MCCRGVGVVDRNSEQTNVYTLEWNGCQTCLVTKITLFDRPIIFHVV